MSTITRTDRLILIPLTVANVEEAHKVYSDPRIWKHRPKARHEDVHTTRNLVTEAGESWANHGFGPWAIYLRSQPSEFVGVGGAQYMEDVWDIKSRLRPHHWANGFATEVGKEAMAAIKRLTPDTPVTARVTTNHPGSIRFLEKLGLEQVWEGRRIGTDDDSEEPDVRVYADRTLSSETLEAVQRRP